MNDQGLIRKKPSDGVMNEIKRNSSEFKHKRHELAAPQQKAFMNFSLFLSIHTSLKKG